MSDSRELTIRAAEMGDLVQYREPEQVLAEATRAAQALVKVVSLKKNPVKFNNEQYLEREDWGTVGAFYGCTAKTVETNFVEFPGEDGMMIRGFEAVAIVIDPAGREIARAESMCLDEEENWGHVPKYEYVEKLDDKGKKIWDANLFGGKGGYVKERKQTGSVKKPLFQLRSMAQTRAEAKALKQKFSWVVVLAGYSPTPAEELTGNEDFGRQTEPSPKTAPEPNLKKRSEKQQQQSSPPQQHKQGGEGEMKGEEKWLSSNGHDPKIHITYKQGNFLFVMMKKTGIDQDMLHTLIKKMFNVEHRNQIKQVDFPLLLDTLDPDFEHHTPQENRNQEPASPEEEIKY